MTEWIETNIPGYRLRFATVVDVDLVFDFICQLADYEQLRAQVSATPELLRKTLFCDRPAPEVLLGYDGTRPVAFALFFSNFSTFLGRPGIYLEDIFVIPTERSRGFGKALLVQLGQLAMQRGCGRVEWAVLNWNRPAIDFYERLGAQPMAEWTVYRLTGAAIDRLAQG